MPVENTPTTMKGRMRGANPAEVFWPAGDSRFTRLPTTTPRRWASSSPMITPGGLWGAPSGVARGARSATPPLVMLERMPSTEGAVCGSMPRSTSPFTPCGVESMTSE